MNLARELINLDDEVWNFINEVLNLNARVKDLNDKVLTLGTGVRHSSNFSYRAFALSCLRVSSYSVLFVVNSFMMSITAQLTSPAIFSILLARG